MKTSPEDDDGQVSGVIVDDEEEAPKGDTDLVNQVFVASPSDSHSQKGALSPLREEEDLGQSKTDAAVAGAGDGNGDDKGSHHLHQQQRHLF